MKKDKLKILIVFGGMSTEHDVSVISALYTLANIKKDKYEIFSLYINREGNIADYLEFEDCTKKIFKKYSKKVIPKDEKDIEKVRKLIMQTYYSEKSLKDYNDEEKKTYLIKVILEKSNLVFPIFHGFNGEDGTIQGLLEFLKTPYIGSGILASTVGVDKEITKSICIANKIPVVDYTTLCKYDWCKSETVKEELLNNLEFPVFIKPAHLGSSIGIGKAENIKEIDELIKKGFEYDDKIIFESGMKEVREITISVMGNCSNIILSELGEFNREGVDYFDFKAKYGTECKEGMVPANIPKKEATLIKEYSKLIFEKLGASGFIRLDYFYSDGKIVLNEVNTIPGLEQDGTFGKIWERVGYNFNSFFDKIVEFGMERYAQKSDLNYEYYI